MRPRRSVVGFEGSLGIQAEVPCEAGARDEDAATYPEGGNFSTPHRFLGGALLIPSSSADLLHGVVSRLGAPSPGRSSKLESTPWPMLPVPSGSSSRTAAPATASGSAASSSIYLAGPLAARRRAESRSSPRPSLSSRLHNRCYAPARLHEAASRPPSGVASKRR